MADAKTRPTATTFDQFLARSVVPARHADCLSIATMMHAATGDAPVMWGSIVGFGRYQYHYANGRLGVWPVVAFAPRKADLTLYIMPGFDRFDALLAKLGKYKTGKACLYIKRLADVDAAVLQMIIAASVAAMASRRVLP